MTAIMLICYIQKISSNIFHLHVLHTNMNRTSRYGSTPPDLGLPWKKGSKNDLRPCHHLSPGSCRVSYTKLSPQKKRRGPLWSGLMKTHWFPLIRPAIKPLFLGGGTLGGVGWIAMKHHDGLESSISPVLPIGNIYESTHDSWWDFPAACYAS